MGGRAHSWSLGGRLAPDGGQGLGGGSARCHRVDYANAGKPFSQAWLDILCVEEDISAPSGGEEEGEPRKKRMVLQVYREPASRRGAR
jgi:hypothetical protein